jgi:DNA-binding MarR family transcriptional regulator
MSSHSRGNRPLTDADYERLAEFRYLLRRFLVFSEQAAEQAGLTAQQHQALLAIKGVGTARPMTTGNLAERLGTRHHSAVGLVDRLLSKSLVKRKTGSEDKRQVLLTLTPKAETLLATLSAAHRDELRRLAPLLRTPLKHFGTET